MPEHLSSLCGWKWDLHQDLVSNRDAQARGEAEAVWLTDQEQRSRWLLGLSVVYCHQNHKNTPSTYRSSRKRSLKSIFVKSRSLWSLVKVILFLHALHALIPLPRTNGDSDSGGSDKHGGDQALLYHLFLLLPCVFLVLLFLVLLQRAAQQLCQAR